MTREAIKIEIIKELEKQKIDPERSLIEEITQAISICATRKEEINISRIDFQELIKTLKKISSILNKSTINLAEVYEAFSSETPLFLKIILNYPFFPPEGTLLHHAISLGSLDFVELLIGFNAPIHDDPHLEETPLSLTEKLADSAQGQKKENFENIKAFLKSRTRSPRWEKYIIHDDTDTGHRIGSLNRVIRCLKDISKFEIEPDKNVVILCGNSQMGKSTFGNFLRGTNYKLNLKNRVHYVTPRTREKELLKTGGKDRSETLYPKLFLIPGIDNCVFIDMPGLEDTRGIEENMVIAAAVGLLSRTLSDKDRPIRVRGILFLHNFSELISGSGFGGFSKAVLKINQSLISQAAKQKLFFIPTKPVVEDQEPPTIEDVKHRLRAMESSCTEQSGSGDELKVAGRELTNFLISTEDHIIVGDVTDVSVRESVKDHLGRCSPLPTESHFELGNLYKTFEKLLLDALVKITQEYDLLKQKEEDAKTAKEKNDDDISGALREKEKIKSRIKNLGTYHKVFADKENEITGLREAEKSIVRRRCAIQKEIGLLENEKEYLTTGTDGQQPDLIETKSWEEHQDAACRYFEEEDREAGRIHQHTLRTLVSKTLELKYARDISAIQIRKKDNCEVELGYYGVRDAPLVEKSHFSPPKYTYDTVFIPFLGSLAIDGRFIPNMEDQSIYKRYCTRPNSLLARIQGKAPHEGEITVSDLKATLDIIGYKRDSENTLNRLTEIDEEIAVLNDRLEHGEKALDWVKSELQKCEQEELPKLESDQKNQTRLEAQQLTIDQEIKRLRKFSHTLEKDLQDATREYQVNEKFFIKVAHLIMQLGYQNINGLKNLAGLALQYNDIFWGEPPTIKNTVEEDPPRTHSRKREPEEELADRQYAGEPKDKRQRTEAEGSASGLQSSSMFSESDDDGASSSMASSSMEVDDHASRLASPGR